LVLFLLSGQVRRRLGFFPLTFCCFTIRSFPAASVFLRLPLHSTYWNEPAPGGLRWARCCKNKAIPSFLFVLEIGFLPSTRTHPRSIVAVSFPRPTSFWSAPAPTQLPMGLSFFRRVKFLFLSPQQPRLRRHLPRNPSPPRGAPWFRLVSTCTRRPYFSASQLDLSLSPDLSPSP